MKHICFLSSSFTREDPRILQREAISLSKAGYKVTYIVSDNRKDEIISGVSVISTGYKPQGRFQRFFYTKRYLFILAKEINADIYQVSEPELIKLGLKLSKLGKKVIFDMREDYVQLIKEKEYIPVILRPLVASFLQLYLRFSLPKFDAVLAVDPLLVSKIEAHYKVNNVHLITNFPVLQTSLNFSFEDYINRRNLLFYSGTVYRISRQEVLLKALNHIKNLKYLIAGQLSESYKEELEKLPYWSNIIFVDGSDYKKVKSLHFSATIGNALRDFSKTGFPDGSLGVIKIYEYMAAGIPVICSNVALWKKMINKYNCGICVDPNNAEEIERALIYFIENKAEAYQMGQNGKRAVLEEYNWETQANIYLNVIKGL